MALLPTQQRIRNFTDIVAEVYNYLSGVAGWVIDKYIQADINYINEATGPFVVGETITWTGSSGVITALVDNGTTGTISFYLVTGTMPVDTTAITGGTSAATADVSGAPSITTDTELYIHTIAAGDSTAAYYSMQLAAIDTWSQQLILYPNTGFAEGSLVDAQPGVPTNAAGALSYSVTHGTAQNFTDGFLVANENFFFITCFMPGTDNVHTYDHCFMGNPDKDFAFTGGQFMMGNRVFEPSTPPSTMYYDNGTADWYTEDGGAFATAGGKALVLNQVHYDASAAVGYSHGGTHINATPIVLFVEHAGGFAPLAQLPKIGRVVNLNQHLVPYGEIRIANSIYLSVPIDNITSDHLIIETGAY